MQSKRGLALGTSNEDAANDDVDVEANLHDVLREAMGYINATRECETCRHTAEIQNLKSTLRAFSRDCGVDLGLMSP